jgi:aspartyl-tRNA(Asn)/glutamyl-tRNA(Gln) amidotransferase subunit C
MEIDHIAKLAKLSLSKSEKKELEKDFKKILEFVEKLKEVDIEKVKVKDTFLKNVLRKDEIEIQDPSSLLKLFPKTKKGYLKVKKIL